MKSWCGGRQEDRFAVLAVLRIISLLNRQKKAGVCDKCGGALYQRDDDKMETVKKRLSVYAAQTKPLIDYYKNSNLYIEINGAREMDAVFNDIVASLGKSK